MTPDPDATPVEGDAPLRYSWKPGLFARIDLTVGDREIVIEERAPGHRRRHAFAFTALDPLPADRRMTRGLALLWSVVLLALGLASAVMLAVPGAGGGAREAVIACACLALSTACLVHHRRGSGRFVLIRLRTGRQTVLLIPRGPLSDPVIHRIQSRIPFFEIVPGSCEIADQLSQIERLHAKGLIDDEEQACLRQKLMEEMDRR